MVSHENAAFLNLLN